MRGLLPVLLLCASCAGIRVGTLEPPRSGGLVPEVLPAPRRIVLLASSDAVVNSDPEWSGKSFAEEEWLMAGASPARGAFWYTYFEFDLSVLPSSATYSSAIFELSATVFDSDSPLNIHVVTGEWSPETLTWDEQPAIQAGSVARLGQAGCTSDCADVTRLLNEATAHGSKTISLVVVPARPWESGFRRWNSGDTFDESNAFSEALPRLVLLVGEPPPPASAAQLDRLRGIE